MSGSNTGNGTEAFEVVVTRRFDAPVEEVWKAWSESAYVMRWWGLWDSPHPLRR
jgi:uncharacterized protein YndB with AHSA1/START domain